MKKKSINIKIIYSDNANEQILQINKYTEFIKHLTKIFKEQEQTGV